MEGLAERLTYTVVVVTASIINNSTSLSFLICETEKKIILPISQCFHNFKRADSADKINHPQT